MGAICGKVETQGESRKEVEEDLRIDNRKRNSLIFAVIEWVSAVDADHRVKDQEKLARSRRPDTTRGRRTTPGGAPRRPRSSRGGRATRKLLLMIHEPQDRRRSPKPLVEATSGPCEAS